MTATVTNFGINVRFTPAHYYKPRTEGQLLEILDRHRQGKIRVIASKHSWSDAIVTDDVLIDMCNFDDVVIEHAEDGQVWATVGSGCQIKKLLDRLGRAGVTTPSVGLITEQTIAGAISTGTHGSGKHSLSHYMDEIRLAAYDAESGQARIHTINKGEELRAARCALGCMGVIVSVRFRCVPQYYVTEKATICESIEDVLAMEERSPLQQFFLIPHFWRYLAQERRIAEGDTRPSKSAGLYRLYWFLCIDVALHLCIKLVAAILRSPSCIRFFFRRILPWVIFPRWQVTDRSDRMLVMEHELFRHLEIELFVPENRVAPAADFVRQVLQVFDGSRTEVDGELATQLNSIEMADELAKLRGTFVHHYPICFRKILRDDTLISMASGDSAWWYSISFITYVEPRDDFFSLARFLAKSMIPLFGARLHWGKYYPVGYEEIAGIYPDLESFRDVCARFDPNGVCRNDYANRALGFDDCEDVA